MRSIESASEHPAAKADENDAADCAANGGVARIDDFLDGESREPNDNEIVQHEERNVKPDIEVR